MGSEIRKMFVAEDGHVLIDADYSQMSCVCLPTSQTTSDDRAFKNNEDIHTITASQVFGVSPDSVTPGCAAVQRR